MDHVDQVDDAGARCTSHTGADVTGPPASARRWTRRRLAGTALRRGSALGLAAAGAGGLGGGFPLGAPPTVHAAGGEGSGRVLLGLLQEAKGNPDKTYRLLVQRAQAGAAADDAGAALGGRKLREVKAGRHGSLVLELHGRAVERLAANPAVQWVTLDAPMLRSGGIDATRLATVYDQTVGIPTLWSSSGSGSGLSGRGVGVAVLDTGLTQTLKDFDGPSGRRVVREVLFNANSSNVGDGHGHGTHVAGIVAGNSWYSGDGAVQGKYIGVAPGASLLNVKVSDDTGMSYVSDVINAIDWVIANRQTYNIRVLNLSLISSVAESYLTSPLAGAVERAWFNGIFVVVAAGNNGANSALYAPANDPFVVTVGAADPMGTASRADDGIAPWSSYGTTPEGYATPDVVAPGRRIVSTLAGKNTTLAGQFPDRIVDASYLWLSGTSMAAPIVAGIAALAFEAHPEWTNDQVKWLLLNTATPLAGVPAAAQGRGQVDAAKVVRYTGAPGYANQGVLVSQTLIGPGGATVYANTSTSSWSTSSWSTSSWSTSSWSTSSWSTSSWSTGGALQAKDVE